MPRDSDYIKYVCDAPVRGYSVPRNVAAHVLEIVHASEPWPLPAETRILQILSADELSAVISHFLA